MPKLKKTARPAGQSAEYLFVENQDSGRRFKVKQELRTTAAGQLNLSVTLSPVDADGKALLDPAGSPDVTPHSHTFTQVELSDPAFDAEARVAEIIDGLVSSKEAEIKGRDAVAGVVSKWASGIDLSKRVPKAPPAP